MYKFIVQLIFFIILLILKKIKYCFFFRKWTKNESRGKKLMLFKDDAYSE